MSARIVAIDPLCGAPITEADVRHDLDCVERLLSRSEADWCRGILERKRAELRLLLEPVCELQPGDGWAD